VLLSAILQMNNVEMEMNGELLRTTSAFAIAAAAGVFATNAMAADLGGSCCADLEERVAELEATTARKGNRKVRLTVSGHVNETLLFWDDGEESNAYVVTNQNSRTRFRFLGDAKISPEWSTGYLLEIGVRAADSSAVNQFVDDNTSSTASLDLRHSAWWIESSRLGRLWVGFTDTATDGITGINLSNASVIAGGWINDWNGGFFLRRETGGLSGLRWAHISSQANADVGGGDQRNEIRYVSPTLRGFTFSAAWGEDDFADAALRYAGEFRDIRMAGGIGFWHYADGNGFDTSRGFTGSQGDKGCADLQFSGGRNDSDVDCSAVGMSGSIMHVPTGFYVSASYGKAEDENRAALFANRSFTLASAKSTDGLVTTETLASFDRSKFKNDEDEHWYFQAGVERNFFGIGKSAIYGEVFKGETGAGLNSGDIRQVSAADPLAVGTVSAFAPAGTFAAIAESEVDVWGVGFVQSIDAAAMDLYLGFRNYSGEVTTVGANTVIKTTEKNNNSNPPTDVVTFSNSTTGSRKTFDVEDFQVVMAGGIIRF
jgi:hypothetical protein